MSVCVDTRTGERGEYADFVRAFAEHWQGGRERLDGILSLLGRDIRLAAPGLHSIQGKEAARVAFEKTFDTLPDLTGSVLSWAAREDSLFIEMTFCATIGGKPVSWHNVDRFTFRDGVAIERVAHFDPTRIRRAFLSSPRGLLRLFKRMRSGL